MSYKPISDYGIIGNMFSAALVGIDGSIDWCCLPRFDSPSIFAAILDDDKGGKFHIKPQIPFESRQAYIPNTNVLQTTFKTEAGTVTVTDFMPCYWTSRHRLKQLHEIHRQVACTDGKMALEIVFDPKFNYARGNTSISISKNGIAAAGGTETIALSSVIPFVLDGDKAISRFTIQRSQKVQFILRYNSSELRPVDTYHSADKLKRTIAYWQQKAESTTFSGPWQEAILRSYLALHLMVYSRTGAIIAAPTTSLPEQIGGERNWDYRFAWLRDASLTLNAFSHLGHIDEALGFFNWLVTICGKCGPRTQILYDIDFRDPLKEQELNHLNGYRGSRPVRIGNNASQQLQLDVFGEVIETAHSYLNMGGYISRHTWELLESFINAACDTWHLPDSGIWEFRSGSYHFVYSKLMCWVAVERGIKIAQQLGYKENIKRWRQEARKIRDDILAKGWNPQRQAFTQHYDTQALDASNLLISLYGFLPVSDKRMASTIEQTIEDLSSNGLLRRYRTDQTDDGLSGSEGAFLWCSFWLVRNWIRMGRLEDAITLYQKLLGYSNHLGLFSEMADPVTGEALGNFPQALTHLAVIVAGLELTRAIEEKK